MFHDQRSISAPRVLIVEDDESQREALSDLFALEELDSVVCGTVEEALRLTQRESFEVAVVDLSLPESNGVDFLSALRDRDDSLRVIINTGHGSFDSAKRSLNLGAFAYLEKAGDPEELLRQVHRAIGDRTSAALRATEQRLRAIFDHSPATLTLKDADGRYTVVNRTYEAFYGLGADELRGRRARDVHPGGRADEIESHEQEMLTTGKVVDRELVVETEAGERTILLSKFPVRDADDGIVGIAAIGIDITERKQAESALARSEERYQNLYDSAPDMYFTILEQGVVASVNRFGADYLGYTKAELIGEHVDQVIHPDDRERVAEQIAELFEQEVRDFEFECRMVRKDGPVLWVHQRAHVATSTVAGPAELRVVCRDVTEARVLSEELSYQATHDALTGLVNRRELEHRLGRVLETARIESSEHALCYLDLDQFKVINDTCGHVAGDELLRQLGDLLPLRVRRRDTLARLGGDEFAVLMEHCTLMQARRVANALRSTVHEFRFRWEDKTFSVGVSIGLVPIGGASESVTGVLRAADTACYVAKEQGRNRIHVYHEDDVELALRHGEMQWVSRINRALEEDRLELSFQPIRAVGVAHGVDDLASGLPLHYELLVRMRDEQGALVPPGAFLPAAERYNVSVRVNRCVVGRALRWLQANPRHLESVYLCSINLSGHSLVEEEFQRFVVAELAATGVPPAKICFEVTETAAITNLTSATRFMAALRDLGCHFALDDFGSGLSSFAYLKHLPVDFLKIDGVFVKDIVDDPIDLAMVRSIHEIARVMGKQTIAEFVEDDAILEKLADIGVDYAQGYGIGRPEPIDNLCDKELLAAFEARAAVGASGR